MVSQPRRVENTISRQRVEINFRGWETIVATRISNLLLLLLEPIPNDNRPSLPITSCSLPLSDRYLSSSRRFRIIATTLQTNHFDTFTSVSLILIVINLQSLDKFLLSGYKNIFLQKPNRIFFNNTRLNLSSQVLELVFSLVETNVEATLNFARSVK